MIRDQKGSNPSRRYTGVPDLIAGAVIQNPISIAG